jgi:hypothetical protein
MTTISIVDFNGQTFFECDGIRFNHYELSAQSFDRESAVDILKDGELVDSGQLQYMKNEGNSSELCFMLGDSSGPCIMFVGLKSKQRGRELAEGIGQLLKNDFVPGETIVLHACPERKFVVDVIANGLVRGRGNYFSTLALDEYPYPIDWRQNIEKVRRIWHEKLSRYEKDVRESFFSIPDRSHPRPPVKKDSSFDITVCEIDGAKSFLCRPSVNSWLMRALRVNLIPILDIFSGNYHELEVYKGQSDNLITKILIYTPGFSNEPIFGKSDYVSYRLLGEHEWSDCLMPEPFEVAQRLKLRSDIEYDFLSELALWRGAWQQVPELSYLKEAWPKSTEQSLFLDHTFLQTDLSNYFDFLLARQVRRLLKEGKIFGLTLQSRS